MPVNNGGPREGVGGWPKVYAWTPAQPAYKHYPQYANFKVFEDGRCTVTVRGPEFRTVGQAHYEMGETVCIQLPPDVTAELSAFFAQPSRGSHE